MQLVASEVAAAVSGELRGPDVILHGAGIDSRTISPGALFVPVVAERDGHDFVRAALKAGAGAYLSERADLSDLGESETEILVSSTTDALAGLARTCRSPLTIPVIGITGSVGKTSTKDLAAAALGSTCLVAASERSFNNELGVPLTVLNAPDEVDVLVVEMGARGQGHIAALCEIAQPTIGVVTTVVAAHTSEFADEAAIARAKGELIEALPSTGTAVLAADVASVRAMARRTTASVLHFGRGGDVWAEKVRLDEDLRLRFVLHSPWGEADVALQVRGEHQVDNALAAASIALLCDVPVEAVVAGLAEAELSPWRMELHRTPAGARILNDAYNANPTSMAAALRSLAALPVRRHIAVLGTMAELGSRSPQAHRDIGELADSLGVQVLAVDAAAYGARNLADLDSVLEALGKLGPDDAVLLKGSRVAGLERLLPRLLDQDG